jgi:RNA recognition motif-containing protein
MEYKLFVGNIPFDCKKKDFKKCFQNFDGFVSADLIVNSNSKNFGFVVFNKKNTVDNIIKDNNIIIGERKLRLTRYFDKNNKVQNYIRLENIPDTITDKDIRTEFENYSQVGKCFINMDRETGKLKSTGIVEIMETEIFEQLLSLDVILIKDIQILMKRYVNKIIVNKDKNNEINYNYY